MPELDWPGAVPPIDCRPEAYIISGIQHVSHMVVFGFEIQEPEWSGWESYIPRGIQYFSYRIAFAFQIQEPEWSGWKSYIPRGIQYFSYRVVF
jgi:hypothetical protein